MDKQAVQDYLLSIEDKIESVNDDLRFALNHFEFEDSIYLTRVYEWVRFILKDKGHLSIFSTQDEFRTFILNEIKEKAATPKAYSEKLEINLVALLKKIEDNYSIHLLPLQQKKQS